MKLDNTEGSMIQQTYRQQQTTADSEVEADIGTLLLVPAHHIKSKDKSRHQRSTNTTEERERDTNSKIESKSTAEGFRRQKSFAAAYSRPANDDDSRPVKAISGESLSFLFLG